MLNYEVVCQMRIADSELNTHQHSILIALDFVLHVPDMQSRCIRRRKRIVFLAFVTKRSLLLILSRVEMWRGQRRLVLQGRAQTNFPLEPAST